MRVLTVASPSKGLVSCAMVAEVPQSAEASRADVNIAVLVLIAVSPRFGIYVACRHQMPADLINRPSPRHPASRSGRRTRHLCRRAATRRGSSGREPSGSSSTPARRRASRAEPEVDRTVAVGRNLVEAVDRGQELRRLGHRAVGDVVGGDRPEQRGRRVRRQVQPVGC